MEDVGLVIADRRVENSKDKNLGISFNVATMPDSRGKGENCDRQIFGKKNGYAVVVDGNGTHGSVAAGKVMSILNEKTIAIPQTAHSTEVFDSFNKAFKKASEVMYTLNTETVAIAQTAANTEPKKVSSAASAIVLKVLPVDPKEVSKGEDRVAYIASRGNARAYLVRSNEDTGLTEVTRLTVDDTMVDDSVQKSKNDLSLVEIHDKLDNITLISEIEELSPYERQIWRNRKNANSLNGNDAYETPNQINQKLREGDRLILATKGIMNLTPTEVNETINYATEKNQDVARALVLAATQRSAGKLTRSLQSDTTVVVMNVGKLQ